MKRFMFQGEVGLHNMIISNVSKIYHQKLPVSLALISSQHLCPEYDQILFVKMALKWSITSAYLCAKSIHVNPPSPLSKPAKRKYQIKFFRTYTLAVRWLNKLLPENNHLLIRQTIRVSPKTDDEILYAKLFDFETLPT